MGFRIRRYHVGIVLGSLWPLFFAALVVAPLGWLGVAVGYGLVCGLVGWLRWQLADPRLDGALLAVGILKLVPWLPMMMGMIALSVVEFLLGDGGRGNEHLGPVATLLATVLHGLLSILLALLLYGLWLLWCDVRRNFRRHP